MGEGAGFPHEAPMAVDDHAVPTGTHENEGVVEARHVEVHCRTFVVAAVAETMDRLTPKERDQPSRTTAATTRYCPNFSLDLGGRKLDHAATLKTRVLRRTTIRQP